MAFALGVSATWFAQRGIVIAQRESGLFEYRIRVPIESVFDPFSIGRVYVCEVWRAEELWAAQSYDCQYCPGEPSPHIAVDDGRVCFIFPEAFAGLRYQRIPDQAPSRWSRYEVVLGENCPAPSKPTRS